MDKAKKAEDKLDDVSKAITAIRADQTADDGTKADDTSICLLPLRWCGE